MSEINQTMRKIQFKLGEFYHIYNRGNNKRQIFFDNVDFHRFLQGMEEFNTENPVGSLFLNSLRKKKGELRGQASQPLVEFVSYCLNPNHFHFIVKQNLDGGIQKFMHRLGTGYSYYFNGRHRGSGGLFQGPYKAIHVESNEYLLHLSAYVNLNNKVHEVSLFKSSWDEYQKGIKSLCNKEIILSQFKSGSDYLKFSKDTFRTIKKRKDMAKIMLEEKE